MPSKCPTQDPRAMFSGQHESPKYPDLSNTRVYEVSSLCSCSSSYPAMLIHCHKLDTSNCPAGQVKMVSVQHNLGDDLPGQRLFFVFRGLSCWTVGQIRTGYTRQS